MQRLNPDDVAKILIPHFLCELMENERVRLGIDPKDASAEAGWPAELWSAVEREAKPLSKEQWIQAVDVLGLTPTDVVRLFDVYIGKNPSVWVETQEDRPLAICERPVTSPRAVQSGRLVSVDLNPLRPILYHELSEYAGTAAEIIGAAVSLDVYTAREVSIVPSAMPTSLSGDEDRRMRVVRIVQEMSPEKFGLLERVIDKFSRYSAKQLAVAYQHFSLSIKNH